jgi:putative MATE family efflux protein
MEKAFSRTNRILRKKFAQYLFPTTVTYAALSLNEFLDSMLVSNMLGSEAMAVVSLGMPMMLLMAAVYSLLGSGGSTVYAVALGGRDRETAGRSLTASLTVGLAAGVLILAAGTVFFKPLARLLCRSEELMPRFEAYLRVLVLSAPILISILTFTSFLPAAGRPGLSMTVNVVANVVNIVMDCVYIRVFHMGVEGAAWATLTGYLAGAAVLGHFALRKKLGVTASGKLLPAPGTVKKIAAQGGPDAMTQIGLSLQFAVCNTLASACAGTDGIVAFSLCIQSSSIVSVFYGAMIGSSVPLLSVLHGQRDYSGETGILKTAMTGQGLVGILSACLFAIFAPQAAALYNVTDTAQAALAVHALRIYALTNIPRAAVIVYFRYLKVIGFTGYASLVSALDGFAAIIPAAWIMSGLLGADGLWWAFPASSALVLAFMLMRNMRIAARSGGRLKGPLLFENDTESTPVMDVTITKDPASITGISERLGQICEDCGVGRREAMRAALAVEETAVYIAGKKKQNSYVDVVVRLYKGTIEIDFRSLGAVFDPLADTEDDIAENIRLLRGIASSVGNEYILGMNSTRIVISGGGNGCAASAAADT